MKNDPVELLAPFRKRLAELAPKTPTEQVEHMSLPVLYEAALLQTPRLHADQALCKSYKALGTLRELRDDDKDYLVGAEAWIDAGMSPVMYFTGYPKADDFSRSLLEMMHAANAEFPAPEQLLGNLSLARFSNFLADRSADFFLGYKYLHKVIQVIPDLLETPNWRHFQVGQIKILPKTQKQLADRLRCFIPLLCLHQQMDDSRYYLAKNSLQLHGLAQKTDLLNQAVWNANTVDDLTVLDRFVGLEYGSWSHVLLDDYLVKNITTGVHFDSLLKRDPVEMAFWIAKAVEVVTQPKSEYMHAWPSALYVTILKQCNMEYLVENPDLMDQIEAHHPDILTLKNHVSRSAYALARSLEYSTDLRHLVSPLVLSLLKPEHRHDLVSTMTGKLGSELVINIKKGRDFTESAQIEALLKNAHPLWATAITEWVQRHFSMRDFKPSDSGMAAIVVLLTYPLRGAENKEKAIAWCRTIRSPKWKIEVMHALSLSPQDININDRQKEDFLSRDLGL